MQYEVIVDVVSKFLMLFGAVFVAFISYALYCELSEKVKQVMRRQGKIRFLCKHEYKRKYVWSVSSKDYVEYVLCCRKCGKILKINVVEEMEK